MRKHKDQDSIIDKFEKASSIFGGQEELNNLKEELKKSSAENRRFRKFKEEYLTKKDEKFFSNLKWETKEQEVKEEAVPWGKDYDAFSKLSKEEKKKVLDEFIDKKDQDIVKIDLSRVRFKRWDFLNYAESELWVKLNALWRSIEFEFRFVRYSSFFSGTKKFDFDQETEEDILFSPDQLKLFDYYTGDIDYDDDSVVANNLIIGIPENYDLLDSSRYDIAFFLMILFMLIFEFFFAGSFLWIWLFYNFLEDEFFVSDQDDHMNVHMDFTEVRVVSVYNSGTELTGYHISSWTKPIHNEEDWELIFLANCETDSFFFYDRLKDKLKRKNK